MSVRPGRKGGGNGASDIDAQLLQIEVHLFSRLGELLVEIADFILHGLKVDFGLGLKGIDVARDIEIEAIGFDVFESRLVRVALAFRPRAIAFNDFVYVRIAQAVLLLVCFEIAAGINKENVPLMRTHATCLARSIEDENADRNTGSRE